MIIKSERVGKLVIFQEHDARWNLIKTVFFNYAPVARFNTDEPFDDGWPGSKEPLTVVQ